MPQDAPTWRIGKWIAPGVHPEADLAGFGPLPGFIVLVHQRKPQEQLSDLLGLERER